MSQLDHTSEQNILNMLLENKIINLDQLKQITSLSKETGKTPLENLQEISSIEQSKTKNIHKKTLESEDFYILVKQNVEKTNRILKYSNQ